MPRPIKARRARPPMTPPAIAPAWLELPDVEIAPTGMLVVSVGLSEVPTALGEDGTGGGGGIHEVSVPLLTMKLGDLAISPSL